MGELESWLAAANIIGHRIDFILVLSRNKPREIRPCHRGGNFIGIMMLIAETMRGGPLYKYFLNISVTSYCVEAEIAILTSCVNMYVANEYRPTISIIFAIMLALHVWNRQIISEQAGKLYRGP